MGVLNMARLNAAIETFRYWKKFEQVCAENAGKTNIDASYAELRKRRGNIDTILAKVIDAIPENNGSGDGWHRDGHSFQFKSILYLSDVNDTNGPFEFLPGSHKRWRAAFDTVIGDLPPAPGTRYEPTLIERMRSRFGIK